MSPARPPSPASALPGARAGRGRAPEREASALAPGQPPPVLDVRPPPRLRAAVAVTALVGSFLVAAMPAVGFGDEQAMGWLGVFPLVASLVLGWRLTALAGACAVLAAGVLMVTDPGATPTGSVLRWAVVVALAAFAVLNCLVRERREARLRQVAEVARVAQSAILQPVPSRAGSWSFAARYRSAHRAAAVGGDLLEVVEVGDGRVRAVLGDVRGKGLPAVRLAATALAAFREASLRRDLPLPEVVRLVDRSVSAAAGDEDFVTAAFLELDPGGWVQVVNCGHPPPLRSSARGGQVSALTPTSCSTPLGLNPVCRPDTFTLEQGTACCSSPTACWRRGTPAARCCPRGS